MHSIFLYGGCLRVAIFAVLAIGMSVAPTQMQSATPTAHQVMKKIRGYVDRECSEELAELLRTSEYARELWAAEGDFFERPFRGIVPTTDSMLHSSASGLALGAPVDIISTIEGLPHWSTDAHVVEGMIALREEIEPQDRAGVALSDCLAIRDEFHPTGLKTNVLMNCTIDTALGLFDLLDAELGPKEQYAKMHELRVAAYTDCSGRLN